MLHSRSHRTLPTRAARLGIITAFVGATTVAAALVAVPAQASTNPATPVFAPSAASQSTTAVSSVTSADEKASDALRDARAALASAATLTEKVGASGLDIGGSAAVDTASLEDAVTALDPGDFAISPMLYLPELTAEVQTQTQQVETKTQDVTERFDAAKAEAERLAREAAAKKAAEEAAAKKAAEEAAAAEAAAANSAAASDSGSSASSAPSAAVPSGGSSGDNSPAGAQASAYAMLSSYGWGDDQWGCLVSLWNRESGWNYQAYNGGSGATGIPQALPGSKMASAGADWATNAATQIRWGLGYISGRYGTPCGAWNHSESVGWY